MFYVQIALLGIISGCLYALSATGIVVTYQATGVFNIAHFAIALLAGYLGWQLSGVWGLPLPVVVPVVLIVCGPVLGLVLERVVFRPLQHRRASSSEKLVAALGVTGVILGLVNGLWGPGVQGTTDEPVPRLFGVRSFGLGSSLTFDSEQVGLLVTMAVIAVLLYVLFKRTFLGTMIRAVVDRRELAELSAIDVNRVSQVAWAIGGTLAAMTGLIIAQGVLEPTRIIFFGIETFSVAVVARLTSVPKAILFGFFVMGMGRSLVGVFHPFGETGGWSETYAAIALNLSSIVLFVALAAFRRLDEVGETETSSPGLVANALGQRRLSPSGAVIATVMSVGAVFAPYFLASGDLRLAQVVMALTVIFVSIVCITGFSGHLTLGQASIAGIGAFATARAANSWDLPVLVAMVFGALVAMGAGLLAGYPALRRKGLFLGLTTLGLALIIDRFVFNARIFQGGAGGLVVRRPNFFGIDLAGDRAFYFYELVVVALVLVLAHNLRAGRLGRVLAAMRDSETAAQSVGIGLRRAKLFVFGVSSAMAGIGGALLVQANQNWDNATFNPVLGLFWFTAVVVCGVSSVGGGVLAAILYVAIPRQFNLDIQSAIGLFGLAAVFLGRLPGGLIAQADRLARWFRHRVEQLRVDALTPPPPQPAAPEASPFALRVLAEQENAT
ncbi:MAG: branched-chain amino acid transport system permease protein livM [Actinomycetota bacterium]|jgi:branched-chain amino acid transport system permease protein